MTLVRTSSRRPEEKATAGRHSAAVTYDFLKNIDLVEKHALLILVHVRLAEDLDGALGTRLSVHAHADLTEGA